MHKEAVVHRAEYSTKIRGMEFSPPDRSSDFNTYLVISNNDENALRDVVYLVSTVQSSGALVSNVRAEVESEDSLTVAIKEGKTFSGLLVSETNEDKSEVAVARVILGKAILSQAVEATKTMFESLRDKASWMKVQHISWTVDREEAEFVRQVLSEMSPEVNVTHDDATGAKQYTYKVSIG
jgi:hypothetical protein